jgi:glycosyltransferase involved in cell wall biosynthesis
MVNSPMETCFLSGNGNHNLERTGEMTVLYAGQIVSDRGILELIDAVSAGSGIELVLIGYGRIESEVSEAMSRRRNGVFLGWKSHEEILSQTRDCDVVYAMYNPDVPNNRFASPNKLFEAMACGKPILVNDNTRLAELVRTHNCGLVVPYGDVDSLRAALSNLRDNESLAKELGANGLKAYEKYYNWDIMEDRLRMFFDEI